MFVIFPCYWVHHEDPYEGSGAGLGFLPEHSSAYRLHLPTGLPHGHPLFHQAERETSYPFAPKPKPNLKPP